MAPKKKLVLKIQKQWKALLVTELLCREIMRNMKENDK